MSNSKGRGMWIASAVISLAMGVGSDRARALPPDWCPTTTVQSDPPICVGSEYCDYAENRNEWFTGGSAGTVTVEVQFIIFQRDDGSQSAATEAEVEAQFGELVTAFQSYGIDFFQGTNTFVQDSRFYQLCSQGGTCWCSGEYCRGGCGSEEQAMKTLYVDNPGQKLNIYIVDTSITTPNFIGLGYGPWCSDAADTPGGVVIDGSVIGGLSCGPNGSSGCNTLVHEVGHNLGLWHTFRGSDEVPCGGRCYEGPECDGNCPTNDETCDGRGDFCCDTAGTRPSDGCQNNVDPNDCFETYASGGFGNYMNSGGDGCWSYFTDQQSARMRCYSCNELPGLTAGNDCNNNGIDDATICESQ